jgi:hypothetical protein
MGTLVLVAWIVILGPLGALLLGGIAYSMFVDNLAAGLICGFFFFLPLLLTLVWGAIGLSEVPRKSRAQRASLMLTRRPIKSAIESLDS